MAAFLTRSLDDMLSTGLAGGDMSQLWKPGFILGAEHVGASSDSRVRLTWF